MIIASLRRGYGNLTKFSGRDTRAQFWPFALVHIGAVVIGMMILFAVIIPPILRNVREAAANEVAAPAQGVSISPLSSLAPVILAMGLVLIVLVAASSVRRLHDTGRPGWIAAIPALLFTASGLMMSRVFSGALDPDSVSAGYFFATWLVTMAYNVTLLGLVALLCVKSEEGANRFGDPAAQPENA